MMRMNNTMLFCHQIAACKSSQAWCIVDTPNPNFGKFNSLICVQRHDFSKRGNVKMGRSTMLNEGCRYAMLILDCMSCQFTSSSQDGF